MEETPKPNPPTASEPPAAADPPAAPQASGEPISVDELLRPASEAETEPPEPDADLPRAASILESVLLVSTEPIPFDKARMLLGGFNRAQMREVLALLRAKYPADSSGILVEEVAKGVQFRTNPANQEHVRKLFDVKPPRFSRAALETLAIIAYKQPLTRQEIEQIRGVDCAGSLKTLMDRRLVKVMGKKNVPGKPFLFGTSREFMETFSLGSLSELPSMRDIEDFLAAYTGTPVEERRPAMHLPAIPDGEIEQGGDELAASLAETGSVTEGASAAEEKFPPDVTEAELSDAASKAAGEGGEPGNGD
ncbi:MAG: SMC-Scp complex subunit ScpB [Candidatus Deferrimicrobium sp.]|nr:SMC-Scp complex subunit ScpB [Candidatus Deferrimicrobium sp.]